MYSNRPGYESMILTTPMLIETLDKLQQQTEDCRAPYPDILQLIGTDSCTQLTLSLHKFLHMFFHDLIKKG